MANSNDDYNKARLLAVTAPHCGDWLLALPISFCGLRLDDEAVRVSVGLRLDCKIGEPMNVFVAHLLTQWAAMHSLANTVLDALLVIIH